MLATAFAGGPPNSGCQVGYNHGGFYFVTVLATGPTPFGSRERTVRKQAGNGQFGRVHADSLGSLSKGLACHCGHPRLRFWRYGLSAPLCWLELAGKSSMSAASGIWLKKNSVDLW